MTASNLGICIGCSILYPKEQSSNTSMSNSYASASTILELMIIHHKQLFINTNQQEQSSKSFKSQPDIIPTEFHPVYRIIYLNILNNFSFNSKKSRSGSNENLLETQSVSGFPLPYVFFLILALINKNFKSFFKDHLEHAEKQKLLYHLLLLLHLHLQLLPHLNQYQMNI